MEALSGPLQFDHKLYAGLENTNSFPESSSQSITPLVSHSSPSLSIAHYNVETPSDDNAVPAKRGYKPHVLKACINCKKAHLACDVSRPCKRCITLGKADTCQDVKHKKRGRPKLSEKRATDTTKEDDGYPLVYSSLQIMGPSPSVGPKQQLQPKQLQQPLYIFHEYPFPSYPITQAGIIPGLNSSQSASHFVAPAIVSHTVALILSMEAFCARASDTVTEWWGYLPQEICHRTIYDFISSKDSHRLARMHRELLDSVIRSTQTLTKHLPNTLHTTSDAVHDTDWEKLMIISPGSQQLTDTVHVKKKNGEVDICDITVYLGGGLGADLQIPLSLSALYIVAELRRRKPPEISMVQNTNDFPNQISPVISSMLFDSLISSTPPPPPATSYTTDRIPFPESVLDIIPVSINVSGASSNSRSSYFRPISFGSVKEKPSPHPRGSSNPYSTLAHRYSQRGSSYKRPGVTNPSTQYFLQTSSSMMNAAASAAQPKLSSSGAHSSVEPSATSGKAVVSSDRKIEMSIRSLLC